MSITMVTQADKSKIVHLLFTKYGRTFSEELGIDLSHPGPSALFRWFCATLLSSTRITSQLAMRGARALTQEGWTTPQKMTEATWEERTRTLNEAGYARYDESTSTKLETDSKLMLEKYHGDLRRLREAANRDPARERELLEEFKGIGDVGADIFFREIQLAWDELFPFADQKALSVAKTLGLGNSSHALADLVSRDRFPTLLSALVRCGLAKEEEELLEEARQG